MATDVTGLYGLTFDEDGALVWQFKVIQDGGDDGTLLVQLYSWIMGEPTDQVLISKSDLFYPYCTFYEDQESWHNSTFIYQEERGDK